MVQFSEVFAMFSMATIANKRKKPIRSQEGCAYRFDRRCADDGKCWRSLQDRCQGRTKTDANDVFIFKEKQAAVEVTQQQIMTGRRARRSNKKYQSIRQRISRLHSLRHGESADMALMTTQVSKNKT